MAKCPLPLTSFLFDGNFISLSKLFANCLHSTHFHSERFVSYLHKSSNTIKLRFVEMISPKNQTGLFYFASNHFSHLETDEQLVKKFLHAALDGDVSTVEHLLRDGMPVNVSDEDGYSALYHATASNRTEVVKHLLHEGADVNRQDRGGSTPLHIAALYNYTEITKLLLHEGADITVRNKRNQTPLDKVFKGTEVESILLEFQKSAS